MNKVRLFFVVALLSLVLPAVAAEIETYEVRLQRPIKAGDRFKVAAKVSVDTETKTTLEGQGSTEEKVRATCKLLAEYTAVEVTKRGAACEIRLKVIEAECTENGEKANFLKAGDVVQLRSDEDGYTADVNGEDPESAQAEILDAILFVADDDDATEDETFGTRDKVKVGAEWEMNANALVEDWERDGYEGLKTEDMKGSTTLTELTEIGGKPALHLKGSFKIEAKDVVIPSLPEGMKASRFTVAVTDELDSPVDVTAMESRLKMEYRSETDASGKIENDNGAMVNAVIKTRRKFTLEMAETPLK